MNQNGTTTQYAGLFEMHPVQPVGSIMIVFDTDNSSAFPTHLKLTNGQATVEIQRETNVAQYMVNVDVFQLKIADYAIKLGPSQAMDLKVDTTQTGVAYEFDLEATYSETPGANDVILDNLLYLRTQQQKQVHAVNYLLYTSHPDFDLISETTLQRKDQAAFAPHKLRLVTVPKAHYFSPIPTSHVDYRSNVLTFLENANAIRVDLYETPMASTYIGHGRNQTNATEMQMLPT